MTSTESSSRTQDAITLLQRMVAIPSVSGDEAAVRELLVSYMRQHGLAVEVIGRNIVAKLEFGPGPRLMLNSHIDTVPANAGYTRNPLDAAIEDGKLYGLGSNDAGAAVVSMIHALLDVRAAHEAGRALSGSLWLSLVVEEEVSGKHGIEDLLKQIPMPDSAIVGEPTGLEICIAQKGLMIFNCETTGQACHAANAWRLPHRNAILEAIEDIQRIGNLRFKEQDTFLGPTTLNVTVLKAGAATNSIPDRALWNIDCRVNPAQTLDEVFDRVQAELKSTVSPRSLRLHPMRTSPDTAIVRAAQRARPQATCYGSDTMSDAVFFRSVPTIKCGPGVTERSHCADECVDLDWIGQGIAFYREAALNWFQLMAAKDAG